MNHLHHASRTCSRSAWLFAALVVGVVAVYGVQPVWAHIDPPGCGTTGVNQSLSIFRADGVTLVAGGTVTECETLIFRGHLDKGNDPTACAFEGGQWVLQIGNRAPITLLDPVPCVGGTGPGCVTGVDFGPLSIVVTPATDGIGDGDIDVSLVFQNSFGHEAENDSPGVGATLPKTVLVAPCDDNLFCAPEVCDPNQVFQLPVSGSGKGTCVAQEAPCADTLFCSSVTCNEATDQCDTVNEGPSVCPDNLFCADVTCNEDTNQCDTIDHSAQTCPDNSAFCFDVRCNETTNQCDTIDTSGECGTSDECVERGCDVNTGCFTNDHSAECGSDETCVDRGCDPETGCFERDPDPLPQECTPSLGCRITAGGITPDGGIDTGTLANILRATFGGQVGAPCGCIGCFDEFDHIQGNWQHSRKTRKGSFHAKDYNSLVCGCDGVFDGKLCNPDDREPGPEPRPAPANMACFSGIGDFNPTNGKRTITVAFRVEVEDRSEPGVGKVAPDDVYRIRIWIPAQGETAQGLADQACCTNANPTGRLPNVDDGGHLIHGNIQIHPPLPNTEQGTCPVPDGSCQDGAEP